MTEQELKSAKFGDISIIQLDENNKLLILLCDDVNAANNLHHLLKTNLYGLVLSLTPENNYAIKIDFIDTDFALYLPTNKTIENYPPIDWLAKKNVQLLSTGFREGGEKIRWNQNYLELMGIN